MKTLTTKLNTITSNKATIKELNATNRTLIAEVLPALNKAIKAKKEELLKSEHFKDKEIKKVTLVTLIKKELDSKEAVINTALNLLELGLNVDNTLSLSKINQIIKLHKGGILSKSQINKSTKETLERKLVLHNKKVKLENAKAIVDGAKPKATNNTTKAKKSA